MTIGQFDMAGLEPPRNEPFQTVAERYEQSERYLGDALDWLSSHAHEHAPLCNMAMDFYRNSPQFWTMVEDLCDGVVEL